MKENSIGDNASYQIKSHELDAANKRYYWAEPIPLEPWEAYEGQGFVPLRNCGREL